MSMFGVRLSIFFFILSANIKAQTSQDSLRKNFFIGSSFTYIWNAEVDPFQIDETYVIHEKTLNLNIGYQLHPNFRIGLAGMKIWSDSKYTDKTTHYMLGGSFKYLVDMAYKNDFFVETGFYRGNYCTCTPESVTNLFDVPYKRENLTYWGLGAGVEIKLAKHWQLDLGFYNFLILENIPQKYNFTQYLIGLDFIL